MTDVDTKFSKKLGWNMGERTARFAMIIENGNILYAEKEASPGEVTVSQSPPRVHRTQYDKTLTPCRSPAQRQCSRSSKAFNKWMGRRCDSRTRLE